MNHISKIINQYLKNRFTPEMESKIQQWLVDEEHAGEKDRVLFTYWNHLEKTEAKTSHKALVKTKQRLGMDDSRKRVPIHRKWLRVAAVVLQLLLLGAGYWYASRPVATIEFVSANGQRQQITLPDGSLVWVNAGSTLTYPEKFSESRMIQLSGEAYFSVIKDPKKPFIVQTEYMSVQALGTEFYVTSYPDEEKTTATLVTGTIQIKTADEQIHILNRSQQLSFNNTTHKLIIVDIPVEDAAAWRSGHLVFNDVMLEEILRTMERYYGITIDRQNIKPSDDRFTIRFIHGETFEEAMNVLEDVIGYTILPKTK